MLNIVLYEPEIVLNTGSIIRSCLAMNAKLHLIKPLGFDISKNSLKRYSANNFINLNPIVYEDWEKFIFKNNPKNIFFLTSKFGKKPNEVNLNHKINNVFLVFGKESVGLPINLISKNKTECIRIPMTKKVKCMNLSNVVLALILEAKRQSDYFDLT